MAAKNTVSTSMKEYLKRYESNTELDKKKKKKKSKTRPEAASAVRVVDEDPVWAKPIAENKEDDSADEEEPQVDVDIEVKRMKRLEQIRARRHYNAISEDGSGWVSLSDVPKNPVNANESAGMSPPRKRRSRNDTPSPENRANSEVPDISPPRRVQRSSPEFDLSPPRQRRRRHDSLSVVDDQEVSERIDLLPPRRGRRSSPELDLSPPRQRRRRHDSLSIVDDQEVSERRDLSPPRRGKRDGTDDLVSDLSPPRKSRKEQSTVKVQPKTGLVTGRDVKEEITKAKKDDWKRFQEMDPSISGRGAEPVYRDKVKGGRISKEEFVKSQKKEEKPKEKKLEWGKGLAQKREAEAREMEIEMEKDKPFARTRDDPELDKMLKERVRWGDPMAHLVKKSQYDLLPNLGDSEKMTESGFIIPQEVPNHSWIKRGLEAAPNRYGIRPGRHWDGVDRSNGFEKTMFKRTNEKQATQREAYMWSVSDM